MAWRFPGAHSLVPPSDMCWWKNSVSWPHLPARTGECLTGHTPIYSSSPTSSWLPNPEPRGHLSLYFCSCSYTWPAWFIYVTCLKFATLITGLWFWVLSEHAQWSGWATWEPWEFLLLRSGAEGPGYLSSLWTCSVAPWKPGTEK